MKLCKKELLIFSGIAGATVFIGGLVANFYNRKNQKGYKHLLVIHGMESFGAGIILSALALVLVPNGLEDTRCTPHVDLIYSGGLLFSSLSVATSVLKGGKMGTLLAMMLDFVPESIALGAMFVVHHKTSRSPFDIHRTHKTLPEAFNAYSDLKSSGFKPKRILTIFFFLSFFGIIGALFRASISESR